MLAYRGGRPPETEDAGAKQMERWKVGLADLGDVAINPDTPLGQSYFVTGSDVTEAPATGNPLTGYSIIRADTLDAALAIAKACSFCEIETLEVSEINPMPPP